MEKKQEKMVRSENAMPCPRGYSIDLYCQYCDATGTAFADGYYAYSYARKEVRKQGWVLHNDDFATCPNCKTKLKL